MKSIVPKRTAEKTESDSVQANMLGAGMMVPLAVCTIFLSLAQLENRLLIAGIPRLAISTVTLLAEGKETKGADLSKMEIEQ